MKKKLTQKVISFICAASVMLQIAAPAFAAANVADVPAPDVAVAAQENEETPAEAPEVLTAGDSVTAPAEGGLVLENTNSVTGQHNYSAVGGPASALYQDAVAGQGKKISMEVSATGTNEHAPNFGIFYYYLNDDNFLYVGYDPTSKWYFQYKYQDEQGVKHEHWPGFGDELPALQKGVATNVSVVVNGNNVTLTVNDKEKTATVNAGDSLDALHAQAAQAKIGVMDKYNTKVEFANVKLNDAALTGSWAMPVKENGTLTIRKEDSESETTPAPEVTPEPEKTPEPTNPDASQGKKWFKLTGGSRNGNGHSYGNASAVAPVLALDQNKTMTVGQELTMTLKPSNNWGAFYTYLNDNNWLYVGYDTSSKWYYQYNVNGKGSYAGIGGLPDPVEGKELLLSVSLSRETLMVSANGKTTKVTNQAFMPFTENKDLNNTGKFGVKTNGQTSISFADVKLNNVDCMADTWAFAAQRDGQELKETYSIVRNLTGVVTDKDGKPLEGATVRVGARQTKTDAKGAYTIEGLELGEYNVAVTKPGLTPVEDKVTITEAGPNTKNAQLLPKEELDLSKFDTIESAEMKAYLGREFPVVARYEMKDGKFFRGNENALKLNTVKINGTNVVPKVTVPEEGKKADSRDYVLHIENAEAKLNLDMTVRISVAENTLTWQVVDLTKAEGCAKIATIEIPQLNLLTVDGGDADARFDGAVKSSNTTVSGDSTITFEKDFEPSTSGGYMYAFLSKEDLSAGLFSNSEKEGDNRVVRNNGADSISLTSNTWYYELGDVNGQKGADVLAKKGYAYPTSELPCAKVAIAGDLNGDNTINWNDGALAYRKIQHKAYRTDAIKDLVNYRIVMNFASMAPDPFLATADNLKKVFLATDGLPQALLLKGYGNEGHDSANSEYADIAEREGGAEDFRKLIQIAHDYNTEIGVHINAQEIYPEARSFCEEMIGTTIPQNNGTWGWLDQSWEIDKRWDLASEARWKRLVQFYDRINETHHLNRDWEKGEYVGNSQGTVDMTKDQIHAEAVNKPNNMDFVYLDVWYQDAWETRQIAREFNALDWRFSTEFATQGEYDSTWQHWATDAVYGGAGMKGFNSDIIRFLTNDLRDSQVLNHPAFGGTADNPLLGGFQLYGFEGWGGQKDFNAYIRDTFNNNLPTKFLQHYYVTKWENYGADEKSPVGNHEKEITLHNENGDKVVVTRKNEQRKDDYIERVITLQKKDQAKPVVVLDEVKYLLPWMDNQDNTEKLYHWNLDGGETTWDLAKGWDDLASVTVYELTDQGRVNPKVVEVVNGQITLNAKAATPYIVVKNEAVKELKADFGEKNYVVDPGFNGYVGNGDKLDAADWSGDINSSAVSVTKSKMGSQQLTFGTSSKEEAVSTTISNLVPGKDYVAEIYVQNDSDAKAFIEVDPGDGNKVSTFALRSSLMNYVRCDNKNGSNMQRMQVSFVATAETATLTLKREAGVGNTYMDDIRVVQQTLNNWQKDGTFKQDFESVVQGLYPFVLGPAQGIEDPVTHLAQKHAPYTQHGWNNLVLDDVLEGEWSLKHHGANTGIIYQTLPQNFYFAPGKVYEVSFDYQSGPDKAYAMVVGANGEFYLPAEGDWLAQARGTNGHHVMEVVGAADGQTWIGLYEQGNKIPKGANSKRGEVDFILDNLTIREKSADEVGIRMQVGKNVLYKGETTSLVGMGLDNADFTVEGTEGAIKFDAEKLTIDALKAGTVTIRATLKTEPANPDLPKTAAVTITIKDSDSETQSMKGATATAINGQGGMDANAVLDGNNANGWDGAWGGVTQSKPAGLLIDLGEVKDLSGFRFLTRSHENGRVEGFRYSFGTTLDENNNITDGTMTNWITFKSPVGGEWIQQDLATDNGGKNVSARYIRIEAYGTNNNLTIMEFNTYKNKMVADEANLEALTLEVGETAQMVAEPVGDTMLKGIRWSTEDTDIINLYQDGTVVALKAGTATVTITNAAGLKAEATVTVTPAAESAGWVEVDGGWKYRNEDGSFHIGWLQLNGTWYYCGENEMMLTGWHDIGTGRFYFNQWGHMAESRWEMIDGKFYYFDQWGHNAIDCWQEVDGVWYRFDTNGQMVTDWKYVDGNWYYFDVHGAMLTGWQQIGNWFYFDESGHMLTGWQYLNNNWFYMNESGYMLTGWQYIDGNWFYMDESGHMLTGWQYIDGNWFYMNESGHMLTGWQQLNGNWFYMNESGYMLTGWQYIDGTWYFFNQSGHMV